MLVAHVTCMLYEGCNTIGAHLTDRLWENGAFGAENKNVVFNLF